MPPVIALGLTLALIAFLLLRDYRRGLTPSLALSIPCIWLFLLASRSVTEWMNLGAPITGGDVAEGSPLDRTVFFALMALGFAVLVKRGISWSNVFRNNIALVLFILYCAMSITWSDFPFVAFKRWFKALGDPIVVLIVLSDPRPLRAMEIVMRTCANILLPLSILFIKYYPELGRTYDAWTGGAMYTGVTTNKNMLGFSLMVFGLFLLWRLYVERTRGAPPGKIDAIGIPLLHVWMVGWLFYMANSKTSLLSLIFGALIFFSLGIRSIRANFTACFVVAVCLAAALQGLFDIKTTIAESAGRDASFTGRTEIWEAVLQMQNSPLVGFGYDSFWLGDRLKTLQDRWFFRPTQAHSGYIELYLNLGLIGWILFAGVIVSLYRKMLEKIKVDSQMTEEVLAGRLGMAFTGAYLIYNYTEAAFKTPHMLFFVFLLFAIKYRPPHVTMRQSAPARWSENSHKLLRVMDVPAMAKVAGTMRAARC